MAEFRHFTFMESWLDDMKDWSQEEKNEAIWRIINYGIYGIEDLDTIPAKERSWYRNTFRIIDKGGIISADKAIKGAAGGEQNQQHNHDMVPIALINGCTTAKAVAEYIEGPGANPSWVFKVKAWKDRVEIWKNAGIPMDSKGNPDFSNRIPMDSDGKLLENNIVSSGKSIGKSLETVGNFVDSNGNEYRF